MPLSDDTVRQILNRLVATQEDAREDRLRMDRLLERVLGRPETPMGQVVAPAGIQERQF